MIGLCPYLTMYPVVEAFPIRVNYSLTDILADCETDSLKDLLIVREELPQGKQLFKVYNPAIMTGPPTLHGHEVILGDLPQKIKFDIDAKGDDFTIAHLNAIIKAITRVCTSELLTRDININNQDIFVYSSTNEAIKKYSYHLLVAPTKYAVRNHLEAAYFVNKVYNALSSEISAFVDINTNKNKQSFRMCGCTKLNENRIKRLISFNGAAEFDKFPEWNVSLISYCAGLEILPSFMDSKLSPTPAMSFTKSHIDSPLVKYIVASLPEWTSPFTIREIRVTTYNNKFDSSNAKNTLMFMYIIQFKRKLPSDCQICLRRHDKDNSLVLIAKIYADSHISVGAKCLRDNAKQIKTVLTIKHLNECSREIVNEIKVKYKRDDSGVEDESDDDEMIASTSQTKEGGNLPVFVPSNNKVVTLNGRKVIEAVHYKLPPSNFDTHVNRLEYDEPELRDLVPENQDIPQTICIDAPMKIGKTKKLLELLKKRFTGANLRICILSFRRTFGDHIYERFRDEGFELYSKIAGDLISYNRIILQVESLHRLPTVLPYDLLIMDECESIFDQINSGLFSNFSHSYAAFEWLLKYSKHVICMDAYLSQRTYKILTLHRSIPGLFLHKNTFKRAEEDTYFIYESKGRWLDLLLEALKGNKRIVVPCNSLQIANIVYELIKSKLDTSKKVAIYSSESDGSIKVRDFSNVDKYWANYDILIYTPTVSAGVSFERIHFDLLFGYFTSSSCTVETAIQMIGRVRNISDKTLHLFIENKWWVDTYLPTNEQDIKNAVINRCWQILGKDVDMNSLSIGLDIAGRCKVFNSDYFELWVQNVRVRNYSKRHFMDHIIACIKKAGSRVFIEYIEKDAIYDHLESIMTDLGKEIKVRRAQSIVDSVDLSMEEFNLINEKISNPSLIAPAPDDDTAAEEPPKPEEKDFLEQLIGCEASNFVNNLTTLTTDDIYAYERYRMKQIYKIKSDAEINTKFILDYENKRAKTAFWLLNGLVPILKEEMEPDAYIAKLRENDQTYINHAYRYAESMKESIERRTCRVTTVQNSICDWHLLTGRFGSIIHCHTHILVKLCGWTHIFDSQVLSYSQIFVNLQINAETLTKLENKIMIAFEFTAWPIPKVTDAKTFKRALSLINKILDYYDLEIGPTAKGVNYESRDFAIKPLSKLFTYSAVHERFIVACLSPDASI